MKSSGTRLENWLFGLCFGLLTAVSCLFCASGWGVTITARGLSPGALVFYGSWILALIATLALGPRLAGLAMGYTMGLGWSLAALGSIVRASPVMRWHPTLLGVNLVFSLLGLLCLALSLRFQRRPGAAR